MSREDEQERLIKLRDQQLRARDPHTYDKKVLRTVSRRRRRRHKRVTLGEMFRDIPQKWRGLIIGAVIGMGLAILLPLLIEGTWGEVAGLIAILFLAIVGYFIGQAFDLRDELRDY